MNKLNLVTGANGHLGNNLVRALLENGETVRASVRNPNNRAPFEGLDCEIVQADLMDKDSLLRALEGVDTLYQVAAVFKHWARDPQKEIIEPNMRGTRNVLEAAAEQGVGRIVYVSSIVTLDHGQSPMDETRWNSNFHGNPYYQSKTESEQLAWKMAEELGLEMVSVLPGAIIGPNAFNITPTMNVFQQALNNKILMDINFYFNFVDVRDVTAGMLACNKKGLPGERYILATEKPIGTRRVLEIAQEFNPKVKIPYRPPRWVLMTIAGLMELGGKITGKEPRMMRNQVELYYGVKLHVNIAKARVELG